MCFRGTYTTAHNINATVVGIVERGDEELGLVNYVDANASNTMFASGAALTTTGPSGASGALDGQWHERTGFGNGGSVLTSSETGTENAPTLKTTIDGAALDDGTYDIFAYFWSDDDEDWRLLGGFDNPSVTPLVDFRRFGSQHAEADQFESIETVSANSNDLQLYRAYIGRSEVVGGADIEVFIDDWQSFTGSAIRTWYDGVGYALVSPIGPLLVGDYNEDGIVDAGDYIIWRQYLGQTVTLPNRDTAHSGAISMDDYDSWLAHFGETAPGSGSAGAVPEPLSGQLFLIAVAVAALARFRHTGRS
jgi:hypothetical protein